MPVWFYFRQIQQLLFFLQELPNLSNHVICESVIAVRRSLVPIFVHNSKGRIVPKVLMLEQKKRPAVNKDYILS